MKVLYELNPLTISGKSCNKVAGCVVVGKNIYTVSSIDGEGKQPVAFYKNDKAIPVKTPSGSTSIARHLNSITYYDHLFYIVTRNNQDENQIMAFDSGGIIRRRWKYPRSKIATINHYSGNRFLISVSGGLSVKYRLVEIGDEIEDVGINFRALAPPGYETGNDSFYEKKRLYVTKFKDLSHSAVFLYDISSLKNGAKFLPVDAIYTEEKGQFEIEGVGKGLIACVNRKQNDLIVKEIDH